MKAAEERMQRLVKEIVAEMFPRKPKPPEPDRNIYFHLPPPPTPEEIFANVVHGKGGWKSLAASAAEKAEEERLKAEELLGTTPIPEPEFDPL